MTRKKNKHHWFQKLFGVLGCLLFFSGFIAWLVVGLQLYVIAVLVTALSMVTGPAIADGGGFFETLVSIFEIVVEGVQALFEAISSFFSG